MIQFLFLLLSCGFLQSNFEDGVAVDYQEASRKELERFYDRYGFSDEDKDFARRYVEYLKKSEQDFELSPKGCIYAPVFPVVQNADGQQQLGAGRYIKEPDVFRVVNAARLQNIINKHNFRHIGVARKALGSLPEIQKDVVLSQGVIGEVVKSISLEEAKELAELVKITGFTDFGGIGINIKGQVVRCNGTRNLIRDSQTKKLVFIDTENLSFGGDFGAMRWRRSGTIHPCSQIAALEQMYVHLKEVLDSQAGEWLEDEIDRMLAHQEGLDCQIPLPNNHQYDDPDIDFAQAAKEYPIRLQW